MTRRLLPCLILVFFVACEQPNTLAPAEDLPVPLEASLSTSTTSVTTVVCPSVAYLAREVTVGSGRDWNQNGFVCDLQNGLPTEFGQVTEDDL